MLVPQVQNHITGSPLSRLQPTIATSDAISLPFDTDDARVKRLVVVVVVVVKRLVNFSFRFYFGDLKFWRWQIEIVDQMIQLIFRV